MYSNATVYASRRLSAIALSFLVTFSPALAQNNQSREPSRSNAATPGQTGPEVACPSKSFDEFLSAFAESADLQRRYTRLPLQYGDYADIAGNRIKWRRIKKFEEIPQFVPGSGMVFRSESQRAGKELHLRIENGANERLREAVIFPEGGGDNPRYYFHLAHDCWCLYAIKDAF